MKRRDLLKAMASNARTYDIEFDKDHPVRGGNHDNYVVCGLSVEVPRHAEIAEFTAQGILRTFQRICVDASRRAH